VAPHTPKCMIWECRKEVRALCCAVTACCITRYLGVVQHMHGSEKIKVRSCAKGCIPCQVPIAIGSFLASTTLLHTHYESSVRTDTHLTD